MRIRKIELIGFKSFKDKTAIHFDAGITGIVGPNGCGKSNIVDALLWVMGEMSAKDLRGSTMTDVIFAGSEDYAPSGMAEVSLTLENDGGPFPVQYMKFSEIMVTRRLHRNGESEYFINKEPSRLRDIQEIFMDTGAGSKGFSIIQQGMIGKIIQSKPEERRMLIEEAAGITKFKARKRESQRKLEATDQNLVRLQDIVGELKRQIDSLQRQAQRAERYRSLKSSIEELDLWISSLQYAELRDLAEKAQALFAEAQNVEVEASQQVSGLEAQAADLRLQQLEREKLLEDLQSQVFRFQSQAQKKELEIQSLKFAIEQAKNKEEMNEGLSQEQAARLELLKKDCAALKEKKSQLEIDARQAQEEAEERREAFEQTQSRIQDLDHEITVLRREAIALGQAESSISGQLNVLRTQAQDLQSRWEQSQALLDELKNRHGEFDQRRLRVSDELQNERQAQQTILAESETLEASKNQLQLQIQEKKNHVETLKDSLNQVSSRLYGLENLRENFEGFQEGVKQVMLWQKARAQEVHADGSVSFHPVSEMVEVEPGFELALEASLGPRLQMLVSSNADHSIQAIDYLKEKKLGRSSFLNAPENSEPEALPEDQGVLASLYSKLKVPDRFSAIAKSLVGSIAVVDSIRTALRLRPLHPGWSFVTQEGDVLTPDGVLSGGTPESADSGVMKRKTEMKELARQKEEWSGKLALAQAALKTLEEQFAQASQEFESVVQKKMNQEIRVAELKKDLERAETEHANSLGIIQKQDRDCQRLAQQTKEAQEKIQSLDLRVEELKSQRQVKEEQSQGLLEDYENEKLGFDQFQEQVTELQVQAASLKQELQGLLNQENYLERNIRDLEEQLNRIQGESQKNSLVMDEGHLNLERARLDFDQLIQDLEQSKQTLAQKKNEFEIEGAELRTLEKNLQDSQKKLHDNSARMNEAQLKLEQARMKEQYLVDQIRERYMIELSEIYKTKMNREGLPSGGSSAGGSSVAISRAEGEKELLELKEKLSKIGDVNLSAIQEYEENGKRYEFLLQQQQDLNSAQDQLRRVIDRINKICSKRFKETFELVNERFQKVFPVLFGGGEARLELIEDVEKGEMGIEIVAKPPGKKMQNITLLSGGEKALTAVSLVFSIFLVKPSPYCLLDEVDAPLDDANVFRFNDLVREMAKRSQIIVVTHNKHTMEVAAQLYGVTMQEKGVSTMVSVNLNAMAPSA